MTIEEEKILLENLPEEVFYFYFYFISNLYQFNAIDYSTIEFAL